MTRFRQDNTEGYSNHDLARLNEAFDSLVADCAETLETMDNGARKSYEDHIAERVQAAFDSRYSTWVGEC